MKKVLILTSAIPLLFNFNVFSQNPDHSGLSLDCPASLGVSLSSTDWYDCTGSAGDIMHCQGFVEIGSNLFPNTKLEVTHGSEEFIRQGISLNCMRDDQIKTNEIYFRYQNKEQWAIGNDLFTDGQHNFFIWDHLNVLNNGAGIGNIRMIFTGADEKNAFIGVNNNPTPITNFDVNGGIRSSYLMNGQSSFVQADVQGILHNVPLSSLGAGSCNWQSSGANIYRNGGKVFIGMNPCVTCTSSLYKLYVEGGIVARDVKVTAAATFPDFVFDKKYKLRSLPELEKYLSENKHLPNVPSAAEVEKNEGFEIGEMQTKLLQTLEEQALYIIALQKQMNQLKAEITAHKK